MKYLLQVNIRFFLDFAGGEREAHFVSECKQPDPPPFDALSFAQRFDWLTVLS
jgi:hypothetical protein